MKKELVTYKYLYKGLVVYDLENHKGVIRDCSNLHNVHVIFEGTGMEVTCSDGTVVDCGGSSLHCYCPGCVHEEQDMLFFNARKLKLEKIKND